MAKDVNANILHIAEYYQKKYNTTDTFKQCFVGQMVHESGNGTSALAVQDMNYGGLGAIEGQAHDPDEPRWAKFSSLEEEADYVYKVFYSHYPEIHQVKTAKEFMDILWNNQYVVAEGNENPTEVYNNYLQALTEYTGETFNPTNPPAGSAADAKGGVMSKTAASDTGVQSTVAGKRKTPKTYTIYNMQKLAKGKTYCAPVYPDIISVYNQVPEWALGSNLKANTQEDMSVKDTTYTLTTKIIFGNDKNPQGTFFYRDLSKPVKDINPDILNFLKKAKPDMMKNKFHGIDGNESILPYFPGYKYEYGKSVYRGEEVGEGGYVYSEPGMYENIALLDVASMHPNTVISECFFGPKYTEIFKSIVDARIDIKHEDWDKLNSIFNGKLTKYTEDVKSGRLTSKQLSNALKTAINSVYGLTAANFKNPFKDDRNADNLVAKRGALFMIDLKHAVQEMGYTVAHIKTDSIKIPNADQKIIDFVMDFGKKYGYTFEHEDTYKKMCLVNDAVYIAKNKKGEWTATGTQFAIPYVFKTLFSKEPITFQDLCDTKSVTSALYLDFNEQLPDVSEQEKEYVKLVTKFKKKLISEETFDKVSKELLSEIDKGHDYTFVGKVGQFCPILPNKGGGLLCREKDGKFYSATGSKGYRWLESEFIKGKFEDRIDRSYFDELVNEAIETINKYGDFEMFVADDERVIDCFNCEHFDNGTCIYGRSIDNYILL